MAQVAFLVMLTLGLWGWYGLLRWDRQVVWAYRAAALMCFFGLTAAGMFTPDALRPSTVHSQPLIVDGAQSTINHRLLTAGGLSFAVHRTQSTIDGAPYVGSTIKDIYHAADCRYAKSMSHGKGYQSHDEARADGKIPCKTCLPVIE